MFSRKIYTADKKFTRPPVATVATNFKSASHVEDYGNNNNCDDDEGQPGPSDDYENGGLGRRHLSHRTCCTPVAWVPCVATALLHYLFLYISNNIFCFFLFFHPLSLCLYIPNKDCFLHFHFSSLGRYFSNSYFVQLVLHFRFT